MFPLCIHQHIMFEVMPARVIPNTITWTKHQHSQKAEAVFLFLLHCYISKLSSLWQYREDETQKTQQSRLMGSSYECTSIRQPFWWRRCAHTMPRQATDKVCIQDKTTRDTKKHKPKQRWTEGMDPNVVILFHRSITADKLLVWKGLSFSSFQTVGYFQTRAELFKFCRSIKLKAYFDKYPLLLSICYKKCT